MMRGGSLWSEPPVFLFNVWSLANNSVTSWQINRVKCNISEVELKNMIEKLLNGEGI